MREFQVGNYRCWKATEQKLMMVLASWVAEDSLSLKDSNIGAFPMKSHSVICNDFNGQAD